MKAIHLSEPQLTLLKRGDQNHPQRTAVWMKQGRVNLSPSTDQTPKTGNPPMPSLPKLTHTSTHKTLLCLPPQHTITFEAQLEYATIYLFLSCHRWSQIHTQPLRVGIPRSQAPFTLTHQYYTFWMCSALKLTQNCILSHH